MSLINLHSETQLLAQCQQGNQRAQMKLYKKYAQAMYQVSRTIIKDDFRAEEAMQDAFLQAFDKLDQFKGNATFGAWLKRIVINKALDELKKAKQPYSSVDTIENFALTETDDYTDLSPKIEAVKKAMDQLPENYRIILSLYYLEGYDHTEIAEILAINDTHSRVTLHRAKQKLITLLN